MVGLLIFNYQKKKSKNKTNQMRYQKKKGKNKTNQMCYLYIRNKNLRIKLGFQMPKLVNEVSLT